MKKTYYIITCALAASMPTWAATPSANEAKPITLQAPSLSPSGAFKNGFDYAFNYMNMGGDWGEEAPSSLAGLRFAYERVMGNLGDSENTWSLLGELNTGVGSKDELDVTVGTFSAGANFNFKVSPSVVLYVGPRLGFAIVQSEYDGGQDEDCSGYNMGISGGVRFYLGESMRNAIHVGVGYSVLTMDEDKWGDDNQPSAFSFSIGGTHLF